MTKSYCYVVTDAPEGHFRKSWGSNGETCAVKIGKTIDITNRIMELNGEQSANPCGYRVVLLIEITDEDCHILETILHGHFNNYRLVDKKKTEWFSITEQNEEDMLSITMIKNFIIELTNKNSNYRLRDDINTLRSKQTISINEEYYVKLHPNFENSKAQQKCNERVCQIDNLHITVKELLNSKLKLGGSNKNPKNYTKEDLKYDIKKNYLQLVESL
tara:strand:- start:2514 stop:3164 length:651 start_codon:yes stop_codon:yes gene_type:complete